VTTLLYLIRFNSRNASYHSVQKYHRPVFRPKAHKTIILPVFLTRVWSVVSP